jgi:hypothetical protein
MLNAGLCWPVLHVKDMLSRAVSVDTDRFICCAVSADIDGEEQAVGGKP